MSTTTDRRPGLHYRLLLEPLEERQLLSGLDFLPIPRMLAVQVVTVSVQTVGPTLQLPGLAPLTDVPSMRAEASVTIDPLPGSVEIVTPTVPAETLPAIPGEPPASVPDPDASPDAETTPEVLNDQVLGGSLPNGVGTNGSTLDTLPAQTAQPVARSDFNLLATNFVEPFSPVQTNPAVNPALALGLGLDQPFVLPELPTIGVNRDGSPGDATRPDSPAATIEAPQPSAQPSVPASETVLEDVGTAESVLHPVVDFITTAVAARPWLWSTLSLAVFAAIAEVLRRHWRGRQTRQIARSNDDLKQRFPGVFDPREVG